MSDKERKAEFQVRVTVVRGQCQVSVPRDRLL